MEMLPIDHLVVTVSSWVNNAEMTEYKWQTKAINSFSVRRIRDCNIQGKLFTFHNVASHFHN